jgi:hypothetical protein
MAVESGDQRLTVLFLFLFLFLLVRLVELLSVELAVKMYLTT